MCTYIDLDIYMHIYIFKYKNLSLQFITCNLTLAIGPLLVGTGKLCCNMSCGYLHVCKLELQHEQSHHLQFHTCNLVLHRVRKRCQYICNFALQREQSYCILYKYIYKHRCIYVYTYVGIYMHIYMYIYISKFGASTRAKSLILDIGLF